MQQKSKQDLRAEIQFSDSSEHLYDTAVKNIKHLFDFLSLSNQNIQWQIDQVLKDKIYGAVITK
jgi:hypothetical protein